jgi:23S rRNA pseudouridine1911/1915/1917 synthase
MEDQSTFESQYRRLGGSVNELHDGQRIDQYLANNFKFLTRSGWQKRISLGEVLVNRSTPKISYKLRPGDEVLFFHPLTAEPNVDKGIRVLWQDGPVMAIYKPSGLPMHENGAYRKNTFAHLVSSTIGPEWSAVHRLDRETSGIVLCGCEHAVRKKLADDFEAKRIEKEYLLIVKGIPREIQWTCQGPLGDLLESQIRIKKWVVEGGLPSLTDFFVESTTRSGHALVRAYPKTGRTNQIRIHAAYSGHWILGDKLYHPNEEVFLEYWKTGRTTDFILGETGFHRLCLHAASLSFLHPSSNKRVRIESPLPEDMQDLWISLSDTE